MKGTVNVSDYHGDMIAAYKGEIENINWNGNGVVSFLYNGKQVVICNGINCPLKCGWNRICM